MVVTRKRSSSASEPGTATTGTPRAAKLKKQDDGVASPAPRTTARCVDSSGTSAATTPRRTRRMTDSIVDAAPPSPRPPRTTRSSNNSNTQDTRTPVKAVRSENSRDGVDGDSRGGRQLRVTLRDISTPTTPSARSRRVSGSEAGGLSVSLVDAAPKTISSDSAHVAGTPTTTTVSTPVRRSRRLSSGGVEEAPSQGTPKQLSFTIGQIMGGEGRKTKENVGSKQSCLPVIKEDTEHAEGKNINLSSPKRNATAHAAEEKKINMKSDPSLQTGCDDTMEKPTSAGQTISDVESGIPNLPMPAKDKESSSPAPINKEAESKVKLVGEQIVDFSKCDGKPVTQNTAEDTDGEKEDITEVTKTSDDDEQKTISSDSNVENKNKKLKINSKEEKEQNNAISTSDSMEVTTKPVRPTSLKDKHKTALNDDITNESSTTQDTQVTSSAPIDENSNKNLNGINPLLPQVMAGDKKLLKVIPELEKKIEQIRSVPKGQPVSGRWWKKEKQRFRSINKDASGQKKWSKKMQFKQWREDVMAKSAAIEAEKQKKKEDLKERQRINKIRREENAKKAEIVQVIKDPRKIKKMKRKQLRYIETRDTTNLKQV